MSFWKGRTKTMTIEETHFWRQYKGFVRDFGFSFVACSKTTKERLPYVIEIFESNDLLLGSCMSAQDGWLVFVAPLGSSTDPDAVVDRVGGWSLISEVWVDYYASYAAVQERFPYPSEVPDSERLRAFDETLRQFMAMVRSGQVSVSQPLHRIESDTDSPEG